MPSSVDRGSLHDKADPATFPAPALPAFARGPVLGIAALVGLLLLLLSGRYGYVSDELYFLAAGKYYPAWGYMDQQPLIPLLARSLDALFPGSLLAFRFPSVLVTGLGVVLTALIAREFGGDRRAQVLASAAYPLAPWLLLSGHWLAAATFEPPQWMLMFWLVVRWTRLCALGVHRDRLLLWAGVTAAVAVQTKFQVVVLCTALLISAAATGPRELLRRPLLWVGVAITLFTALPTLFWQARHGWPALDMGTVVGAESARLLFLPSILLYSGIVVGGALVCLGWWFLLREPALRPYRFLAWTVAGITVFFLATSGRPNYLAGCYGLLFAAAAVGLQRHRESASQPRYRRLAWPVYLLSALLPVVLLPLYPLSFLAIHPEFPSYHRLYETGWPELADAADDAYNALPPDKRERTAIVGETYYLAGALDVHGRQLGLPRTYSPHRGYWFFGQPPESADIVLYVGTNRALDPYFRTGKQVGAVKSRLLNLAQGVPVTLYEHRTVPWSHMWPRLRTM